MMSRQDAAKSLHHYSETRTLSETFRRTPQAAYEIPTVDGIKPCNTLRTLNYGNHGIFLTMGNAGFTTAL